MRDIRGSYGRDSLKRVLASILLTEESFVSKLYVGVLLEGWSDGGEERLMTYVTMGFPRRYGS